MLYVCHHCGAMNDTGASRCPNCGGDLDAAPAAPEPGLELAPEPEPPARGRSGAWRWVALGVLVVFAAGALGRGLPAALVALVAVGLLYLLAGWARGSPAAREGALYRRLLVKARGDRALVERLLEHERRASPGLPRGALMRRVLESWERDHQ